jgi:hypothetical protein
LKYIIIYNTDFIQHMANVVYRHGQER